MPASVAVTDTVASPRIGRPRLFSGGDRIALVPACALTAEIAVLGDLSPEREAVAAPVRWGKTGGLISE
jgi:hypothetical protein